MTIEMLIASKEIELAAVEAENSKIREYEIRIKNWMSYALSKINRALALGIAPGAIVDALDESVTAAKWVKDPADKCLVKKAFVNATAEFASASDEVTEADLIVVALRNRYTV